MRVIAILLSLVLSVPALAQLQGHGGPVRGLAVAGEGAFLLSGSFDETAILWSPSRGLALQVLRGHDGAVNAVAALRDGRFATAGQDGRIQIWRFGQREAIATLSGHEGPIAALAAAGEGLASASWDGTVRVWDAAAGSPVRVLWGHQGSVNGVAVLPDGALVSAGADGTVRFWGTQGDSARLVRLAAPANTLVAVGRDVVAVGTADGVVTMIGADGVVRATSSPIGAPIVALGASPDGGFLVAGGLRGSVSIIDPVTAQARATLVGPGLPVWSVAVLPDGRIVTGGGDRAIRLWDARSGDHLGEIGAGASPEPALTVAADDRGATVFRACAACHTLGPDGGNRAGPTLHGLMGRRIGTVPGYNYSPSLMGMDIVWTRETLRALFTQGPAQFTPGTRMPEQTVTGPGDLDALIDFLDRATARP